MAVQSLQGPGGVGPCHARGEWTLRSRTLVISLDVEKPRGPRGFEERGAIVVRCLWCAFWGSSPSLPSFAWLVAEAARPNPARTGAAPGRRRAWGLPRQVTQARPSAGGYRVEARAAAHRTAGDLPARPATRQKAGSAHRSPEERPIPEGQPLPAPGRARAPLRAPEAPRQQEAMAAPAVLPARSAPGASPTNAAAAAATATPAADFWVTPARMATAAVQAAASMAPASVLRALWTAEAAASTSNTTRATAAPAT